MKRTAAKLLLFLSGAVFAGVVMPTHGGLPHFLYFFCSYLLITIPLAYPAFCGKWSDYVPVLLYPLGYALILAVLLLFGTPVIGGMEGLAPMMLKITICCTFPPVMLAVTSCSIRLKRKFRICIPLLTALVSIPFCYSVALQERPEHFQFGIMIILPIFILIPLDLLMLIRILASSAKKIQSDSPAD